jgi:predicted RNA-binding protein associated with RNAse of E/G family
MPQIRVFKLDLNGKVAWQYEGRVLRRGADSLVLEAFFDRPDMPFRGGVLKKGDRFVETYYSGRSYNVFEIYDRDNADLKGWYCNVSRPAVLAETSVSWVDLALDLWIWPDGRQAVLDEDEFAALPLEQEERGRALAALRELQELFKRQRPPL